MTLAQFNTARTNALQQLGSTPTVEQVRSAIAILKIAGAPADADWGPFITLLQAVK